jgi:hypothetical protein
MSLRPDNGLTDDDLATSPNNQIFPIVLKNATRTPKATRAFCSNSFIAT